ncbi:DUF6055 domain-containing protein [Candidatus Sumerlaeota bacterium]
MRNIIVGCAAICFLFAAGGVPAEYEFYQGCQYPGKDLRPGVGVNKVVDPGGEPREYARRTVEWWPRQGEDIIEVVDGMPLRTWTFKDSAAQNIFAERGTIKAHLVGFRGVGAAITDLFGKGPDAGSAAEPAVVLRLADGRKRMFAPGSFGKEDKAFIMELFAKEMARIRANSVKLKYEVRPGLSSEYPNIAKPGEPGTMQVESEHMVWASGSQSAEPNEPWIHEADLAKGKRYRQATMLWSENMWSLYEYSGLLMWGWDSEKPVKYTITIPGTKRDGFKNIGGYAGGGGGGCGIKGANTWLLAHEWGHGIRINSAYVGGGEAGADNCRAFCRPGPVGNHQTRRPARNVFSGIGGYGVTTFYTLMGDNPNWGHGWFAALPFGKDDSGHSFLTIARIGEQRGLFDNGIRGVGDLMGEYAARVATFDCELEYDYRKALFSPVRHWLEPVDVEKRSYRIPADYAPEPWGMNIIRLVPDKGAGEIVVDFQGIHDPEAYSDWRACIVSLGANGIRRYSPLWNKGRMNASINKDDISHWLTVAATPTAMYLPKNSRTRNIGVFCSGRHAWRYPWRAQFTNARPGSPQWTVGDFGVKEAGKRQLVPAIPGSRAQLEAMAQGKRHPNGGGWVQSTATVDPTAYVGPNAMVLDTAQALGNASIEDFAVVRDSARVEGHARVFGAANIRGKKAVIDGYSRAWLGERKSSAPQKSARAPEGKYPVVPLRPGAESLRADGLWAHYAMDAPNNITLEDYYRYPVAMSHGHNRALVPSLDGYVHNGPEFAEADGHFGLRFDGKKQYAEISPRAVDLGEATIVATVRREASAPGVVFDFGASDKSRMTLRFERSGKPLFDATVGGKAVLELQGKTAVPINQWARLRVELDGSVASLWLDKDVIAQKPTSFRPCDVFPPETRRFNTIANSRNMRGGFAGVFDSLVIYHKVHSNFELLPPPITDAPIRPTAQIVARFEKQLGDANQLEKKIRTMIGKEMAPYNAIYKRLQARQEELLLRNTGVRQARKTLAAAKADLEKKKKSLGEEVNEQNAELVEQAAKIETEKRAAAGKMHELLRKLSDEDAEYSKCRSEENRINKEELDPLRKAFFAKAAKERPDADRGKLERELALDPEYAKVDARRSKFSAKANARAEELRETVGAELPETIAFRRLDHRSAQLTRELRALRDAHISKNINEATKRINELAKQVSESEEEAWKRYGQEKGWLKSFEFAGFRGYYNTAYGHYFEQRVRAIAGGGEMREDLKQLQQVQQAYADPGYWHTTVDWDWRMPEEIDGRIDSMPLMRKWLARTRGPVVKTKPTSVKH